MIPDRDLQQSQFLWLATGDRIRWQVMVTGLCLSDEKKISKRRRKFMFMLEAMKVGK